MLSEEVVRGLRDSYWKSCEYFEKKWLESDDIRDRRLVEHYGTLTGVLDVILEEHSE